MRLADRVEITYPGLLCDAPIIAADEVAAQIDRMPGETWDFSPPAAAYGIVAPPFNRFFVEAQTAVDLAEFGGSGKQTVQRGVIVEASDGQDCRWVYTMQPFIWYEPVPGAPGAGIDTAVGRIILHLDSDGRILDNLDQVRVELRGGTRLDAQKMTSFVSFLPFVLKALSVLHQRTVVNHITHSRQMKRQHQRKHGGRLRDYYWLTVQPALDIRDMDDVGLPMGGGGSAKREHTVRGHFRYYAPERPLFGRYSGMVWIPDHKRGDVDAGSIDKDYLIGS